MNAPNRAACEISEEFKIKRIKFSHKEDQHLVSLVAKFGTKNWIYISTQMPGRTPRQCRDRWNHYLAPQTNTTQWTSYEDQIIIEKVKEIGKQWAKIATFVPGRTGIAVRNRCCKLSRQKNADPFLKRILYEENKNKARIDIVDANDIDNSENNDTFNYDFSTHNNNNNFQQKHSSNNYLNDNINYILNEPSNDQQENNSLMKTSNEEKINPSKLPSCSSLLRLCSRAKDGTKLCPLYGNNSFVSMYDFDVTGFMSHPPLNLPVPSILLK
ncbi:hypothetical protein TRFO_25508 [Tritrichomonas foetus]|uniref:Myb-like DNA-binding domain containing protein n=1 Tax=Tritrichomonas foetus TaxID=1144522 RepID=A0A1J4K6G6_9EUKA|nr:hypothetical protein TRFO_25508 [Tritrichomonas foetus]|eukprot:OHT06480.1 hypothetical protein TRFO_25508 [Tritrichomonas foetus]